MHRPLTTFLRMTLSHKVQQHLSIPLALKETDLTQGMAWLPLVPLSLLFKFNLNKKSHIIIYGITFTFNSYFGTS